MSLMFECADNSLIDGAIFFFFSFSLNCYFLLLCFLVGYFAVNDFCGDF